MKIFQCCVGFLIPNKFVKINSAEWQSVHMYFSQAYEQVKRIEVNRSSGGKVNKRRTSSVLNSNGHKLFKDLLDFVAKCSNLEILTFEHVELGMPVIFHLCKSLVTTTSRKLFITLLF